MKHIAICTPEISYNDAVSNDVIGMFDAISNQDFKVGIFAQNIFIKHKAVRVVDSIGEFIKHSKDIIIYHLSTGWFKGLDILINLDCKKIIKYHNITPPEYFYGFSSDHMATCKGGREQLDVIAGLDLDMYLNDSRFNMMEMVSKGVKDSKCFVVPPFNNIKRLRNLKPDFNILKKYNDEKVNILSVGRVAPNKGFEKLIEVFAVYNKYFNEASRLIIVGDKHPRLAAYINYLSDKVRHLNLENSVVFTGKVSEEKLKSYFIISKNFILTSYHEGFCVPLVEAMSLKVPVLAYGSTAVTDTIGDGGIAWEDLDIRLMAVTIDEIVNNRDTYFFLGEEGWKRYEGNYTDEKIQKKFLNILGRYL